MQLECGIGNLLAVVERGIESRQNVIAAVHWRVQGLFSILTDYCRIHHRLKIWIPSNNH